MGRRFACGSLGQLKLVRPAGDPVARQRWTEGQVAVAGGGGEEGFAFAQGDEQQVCGAGLVPEHAFAVAAPKAADAASLRRASEFPPRAHPHEGWPKPP